MFDEMYYDYLGYTPNHPIYDPPEGSLFSPVVYKKGGMVLRMLQGVVGDSTFFDILHTYYDIYQYDRAVISDFQEVCEDVYGEDLDWFFDEWIYEAGHPIFDVKWDYWETENGYMIEASLKQTQEEWELFVMPTEVGADYGDDNYELSDIQINDWDTYISVEVSDEPQDFAVDPWEWFIVKQKTVEKADKFYIQNVLIEDENDNQVLEANETVNLTLTLLNRYLDSQAINATLQTADESVTIVDGDASFGDIPGEEQGNATNVDDPFVMTLAENVPPHNVEFTLFLTDANGYEFTIDLQLFVGIGDILLVDDDDGADYEDYYLESLAELNQITHHRDVIFHGDATENLLQSYSTVIWFTGDASQNTLTESDRTAIAAFLDNGGDFFVTGQDISDEIGDTDFFADYLHAEAIQDSWQGTKMLKGIDGDPIGDGSMVVISGEGGADNQISPSVIEPTSDAHKSFGYMPSLDGGAVRYDGDYKTVFFAFGFEAVNKTNQNVISRTELLADVLTYFGIDVGVDSDVPVQTPDRFNLAQNYPNPFNPETQIRFELPQRSEIELSVYDVSGKLVKTLISDEMEAGGHVVKWNGDDADGEAVGSGVYLYRIEMGGLTETRRMILLR
jgi:hypothetical protein